MTIPTRITDEARKCVDEQIEFVRHNDGPTSVTLFAPPIIAKYIAAAEQRGREMERTAQGKRIADLEEEKAHLLDIGSKAIAFRIADNLTVVSRGLGLWAVSNGHAVANTFDEWEIEPLPSNRDDEFISRTRFSFPDAMMRASAIRSRTTEG